MDTQSIINTSIAVILTGLGWFGRQLWDAVEKLKDDIQKIEVDLPSHYIRRDEFKEGVSEIKTILGDIFKKIDDLKDRKQDK